MRRRLLAVLALSPLLVLLACSDDEVDVGTAGTSTPVQALAPIPGQGAPEPDRLDAARAHWEAAGLVTYEWTYERSCFCPPLEVRVAVTDGVGMVQEPVPDEDVTLLTMPDLFDLVQEQIDDADSFSVEYEPTSGRVIALDVDPITNAVDDEFQYTVTAFAGPEPIGETTTTTTAPNEGARVDGATFTESYPCGRSFQASNADQTVGLFLEQVGPSYETVPPPEAEIPSAAWTGRVVLGADLFANWCDDVIEQGEPTPRTDETWPIVEGTIAIDGNVSGAESGPVTARLTGIVAERPDGTRVEVGDLEILNEWWGGAAG
jgi:Family of unknown function (DUF6174)